MFVCDRNVTAILNSANVDDTKLVSGVVSRQRELYGRENRSHKKTFTYEIVKLNDIKIFKIQKF